MGKKRGTVRKSEEFPGNEDGHKTRKSPWIGKKQPAEKNAFHLQNRAGLKERAKEGGDAQ